MNETSAYLDFPGADALQAAGRVAPPSEQAMDRARTAVSTAVHAATAAQAEPAGGGRDLVVTPVRTRRTVSGRRIAAVFALAAAAAGVVVGTNGGTSAPAPQRPSAVAQQPAAEGATAFLNGVAEVAATRSASTAPYWKAQIKNVTGARSSTVTEYVSRQGYVFLSRGKIYHKGAPTWSVGTKLVDWNGLDRLPTAPATLLSMMSAAQPSRGAGVFDQAGVILADSPASPALRAGLFKALGRLNGVKVVGPTKDSAGRSGTELTYGGSQGSEALIIDPKTATVLEMVFWQAGGVSRTTYLTVGPAMSIG